MRWNRGESLKGKKGGGRGGGKRWLEVEKVMKEFGKVWLEECKK